MLVICVTMATGYSMYSEQLTINATAIARAQEIVVPPQGEDENGVTRFTSSVQVENIFGMELLRVTKEEFSNGTITTTMKVMSQFAIGGKTLQIKLNIQNGSKSTFTNGKVELLESGGTQNSLTSRTQNMTNVTVEPGGATEVTIKGSVYVGRITTGTYYKYKIYFDTENGVKEFYYILKLEP